MASHTKQRFSGRIYLPDAPNTRNSKAGTFPFTISAQEVGSMSVFGAQFDYPIPVQRAVDLDHSSMSSPLSPLGTWELHGDDTHPMISNPPSPKRQVLPTLQEPRPYLDIKVLATYREPKKNSTAPKRRHTVMNFVKDRVHRMLHPKENEHIEQPLIDSGPSKTTNELTTTRSTNRPNSLPQELPTESKRFELHSQCLPSELGTTQVNPRARVLAHYAEKQKHASISSISSSSVSRASATGGGYGISLSTMDTYSTLPTSVLPTPCRGLSENDLTSPAVAQLDDSVEHAITYAMGGADDLQQFSTRRLKTARPELHLDTEFLAPPTMLADAALTDSPTEVNPSLQHESSQVHLLESRDNAYVSIDSEAPRLSHVSGVSHHAHLVTVDIQTEDSSIANGVNACDGMGTAEEDDPSIDTHLWSRGEVPSDAALEDAKLGTQLRTCMVSSEPAQDYSDALQHLFDRLVSDCTAWAQSLTGEPSTFLLTILANVSLESAHIAAWAAYDPRLSTSTCQKVILSFFACSATLMLAEEKDLARWIYALHTEALDWTHGISSILEVKAYRMLVDHLWFPAARHAAQQSPSLIHSLAGRPREPSSSLDNLGIGLQSSPTLMAHVSQVLIDVMFQATGSQQSDLLKSPDEILSYDGPPSFKDCIRDEVIIPCFERYAELPDYESLEIVRIMTKLRNEGSVRSYHDVQRNFQCKGARCPHGTNPTLLQTLLAHCMSVSGRYGVRALNWLGKAVQRSACRVVSQPHATSPDMIHLDGSGSMTRMPPSKTSTSASDTMDDILYHDVHMVDDEEVLLLPSAPARRPSLPRNMTIAADTRAFLCHICSKAFGGIAGQDNWRRHMRETHSGKRYKCNYCGKKYSRPNNRNRHQRKVHGSRF